MLNTDTRSRILDTAQRLAQQRGFNAFSYADVATEVGVRKASIHHHFPSKDDLELALVQRYSQGFDQQLVRIDQQCAASAASAADRLREYGLLYRATLQAGAVCLCGMMASDIAALPELLRAPLRAFFLRQAQWLAQVLEAGRQSGEFVFFGPPMRRAHALLATLQGGLIVAHATRDLGLFDALLDDVLTSVGHR